MYRYLVGILFGLSLSTLHAQTTITVGKTVYQNQAFSAKDKQIFDADREGSRVWGWSRAQNYCKKLTLGSYDNWRVASTKELQAIMTKKPSKKGLFVKQSFAKKMPKASGKYDNVWMWTRNSTSKNLGGFVNVKKATNGWADRKYKGYVICTRPAKRTSSSLTKKGYRQETSKAGDWASVYYADGGIYAFKRNGTLWEFSKINQVSTLGVITPIDTNRKSRKKVTYHLIPKRIGKNFDIHRVSSSGGRIYAIKKDGTLWGWGREVQKSYLTKPTQIGNSREWHTIKTVGSNEAGECGEHTLAYKKDGSLWAYGDSRNEFFTFVKNRTMYRMTNLGKTWRKVTMGCYEDYAQKSNGSFWTWGASSSKRMPLKSKKQRRSVAKKLSISKKSLTYHYSTLDLKKYPETNKQKGVQSDGSLWLLPELTY